MVTRSHAQHGRCRGEAGESLAELLVAIAIVGIAVVVIVGSMAAAIGLSTQHRQQATGSTLLTSAADAVKSTGYLPCSPTAPDYSPALGTVTIPSGYTVTVNNVRSLDTTGASVPCPSTDTKLELVTVSVKNPSGVTTSVDVTKRTSS